MKLKHFKIYNHKISDKESRDICDICIEPESYMEQVGVLRSLKDGIAKVSITSDGKIVLCLEDTK